MFTTVHGKGKPISFLIPFIIIILLYNIINHLLKRKKVYNKIEDKASLDLKILIAIFPPYGLYLYFKDKSKLPKKSEEIRAFLIYGLFLWAIITFISFLLEIMV
jgi:hypothetical protein